MVSPNPPDDAVGTMTQDPPREKVVLIEDHEATREIFQAILESEGYTVTAAEDGRRGIEAIRTVSPDVVVTDIAMPGLDGIQVVRAVRSAPDIGDIPVVAATAQSSGYDTEELRDVFVAVLRKPVHPRDLLGTVARVLSNRSTG